MFNLEESKAKFQSDRWKNQSFEQVIELMKDQLKGVNISKAQAEHWRFHLPEIVIWYQTNGKNMKIGEFRNILYNHEGNHL